MSRPTPPPDNVLILQPDGTVSFVSRMLGGVSPDQVLGTSIYDYVSERERGLVEDCLERVFAGAETAECELTGMRPAALDAWFECRFSLNRAGSKTQAASVVVRDITARREREAALRSELEALRAREGRNPAPAIAPAAAGGGTASPGNGGADPLARFLSTVQESGEAMFVTDAATGRIVDANTTACRWLRMRRRDVVGATERDLGLGFPLTLPPSSTRTLTDTRTAQRPLIVNHARHRRGDGSVFPVEVSLTHHRIEGHLYVLAVAREVNDREKIREQVADLERVYGALFTRCQDAVILTARDGRMEAVNAAAATLLGYDRETLEGQQLQWLYVEPDDIQRFRDAVRRHGEVHELVVGLRKAEGSALSARLSAVPRRGADGQIRGYQCIVQPSEDSGRVARRVSPPTHVAAHRSPGGIATSVAQSEPRARTPATTRPASADVLLLVPEERGRDALRTSLISAGMHVTEARSFSDGLRLVRDPEQSADVVLLDTSWAAQDNCAPLEAAGRHRPGVPVLLTQSDGEVLEAATRSKNVRGTLALPAHPLTLVQRIREVLHGR